MKTQTSDEAKKRKTYPAARAEAQAKANKFGYDYGLEWNSIFKSWHIFMLPAACNRYGFELRCEVVSCEIDSKCRPGHGVLSHLDLKPKGLSQLIVKRFTFTSSDGRTLRGVVQGAGGLVRQRADLLKAQERAQEGLPLQIYEPRPGCVKVLPDWTGQSDGRTVIVDLKKVTIGD